MYDLIDRPVHELPTFERGVLDRARRWVHAFSMAGTEGVGDSDDALSVAMHALDRGSAADIVLQRPCFATVEESEAVLLGLWRLVRDGRLATARGVAESLVDERHVTILLDGVAGMIAHG